MKNKFKFCPQCGKRVFLIENKLIDCQSCGFHFYITPPPTAVIILENEEKKILLVKRKVQPRKKFWDLPGGFIDLNEKAEEAIKRELQEELNIRINRFNFLGTYVGFYSYKGINYKPLAIIFYGKITKEQIRNLYPADDISSFKFFSKDKIPWRRLAFVDVKQALRDYLS